MMLILVKRHQSATVIYKLIFTEYYSRITTFGQYAHNIAVITTKYRVSK